jgi:hypothetical protein
VDLRINEGNICEESRQKWTAVRNALSTKEVLKLWQNYLNSIVQILQVFHSIRYR